MAEPIVIKGKCYQKGWFFGFYGRKNKSHFSISACLPGGVSLHEKNIRMTIEILDKEENR